MNKLLLLLAIALLPLFSLGQDSTTQSADQLLNRKIFFTSNDVVEITLVSDFKRIKSKRQKGVFQPATATVKLPNSAPITEDIQLAARGVMRRSICSTPPLTLNFKNTNAPRLSALKKMKLVSGCSQSGYDEELVLKEYLVYKMFNMLTDFSYRVRLAKVSYKDVQNKGKEFSQYGFLVEDLDDMAKRNNCREYPKPVLNAALTDRNQMTLVSMFEYMIGNTDWSLPNRHNLRFVQLQADSVSYPYVVPYDFDYAGIVNAPYAVPHASFGIEKVTDRYYRGMARAKEEIDPLVQLFKEKKPFLTALIQEFSLLKKSTREEMLDYVEEFYKDLDDKRKLTNIFEKAVDHN